MHTFDLIHVGWLKVGHLGLHLLLRLLIHNSRSLLRHLGQERGQRRVTMKWPAEDPAYKNPYATEPSSFMAASQAATRAEEGRQPRRREVVATSKQPNSDGGPAADHDVMTAIR